MSVSCTDDPDQMCRHVVALANSGGGTIFLGMDPDPKTPIAGLADATSDMRTFQSAVSELIFPQPDWSVDIVPYEGHEVIQIEVRDAQRKPCYMREQEDRAIYVRHNGETVLASHGDLIDMLHSEGDDGLARNGQFDSQVRMLASGIEQPKSGVEIVGVTLAATPNTSASSTCVPTARARSPSILRRRFGYMPSKAIKRSAHAYKTYTTKCAGTAKSACRTSTERTSTTTSATGPSVIWSSATRKAVSSTSIWPSR